MRRAAKRKEIVGVRLVMKSLSSRTCNLGAAPQLREAI